MSHGLQRTKSRSLAVAAGGLLLVRLKALPRAVGLHELVQLSLPLDLEVHDIAVLLDPATLTLRHPQYARFHEKTPGYAAKQTHRTNAQNNGNFVKRERSGDPDLSLDLERNVLRIRALAVIRV